MKNLALTISSLLELFDICQLPFLNDDIITIICWIESFQMYSSNCANTFYTNTKFISSICSILLLLVFSSILQFYIIFLVCEFAYIYTQIQFNQPTKQGSVDQKPFEYTLFWKLIFAYFKTTKCWKFSPSSWHPTKYSVKI